MVCLNFILPVEELTATYRLASASSVAIGRVQLYFPSAVHQRREENTDVG